MAYQSLLALGTASAKTFAADVILAGLVFYGSIWLYELSNYVCLTLSGASAFLSVQGILPVGVIAVSSASPVLSFTKLMQVVICASAAVALLWTVKNRQLPLTKMVLIAAISLYVASFQWELLSQMNYVTEAVHQGSFLLITVLFGALITVALGKPLRLGLDRFVPCGTHQVKPLEVER